MGKQQQKHGAAASGQFTQQKPQLQASPRKGMHHQPQQRQKLPAATNGKKNGQIHPLDPSPSRGMQQQQPAADEDLREQQHLCEQPVLRTDLNDQASNQTCTLQPVQAGDKQQQQQQQHQAAAVRPASKMQQHRPEAVSGAEQASSAELQVPAISMQGAQQSSLACVDNVQNAAMLNQRAQQTSDTGRLNGSPAAADYSSRPNKKIKKAHARPAATRPIQSGSM